LVCKRVGKWERKRGRKPAAGKWVCKRFGKQERKRERRKRDQHRSKLEADSTLCGSIQLLKLTKSLQELQLRLP
jgi:hypothetical protein